MLLAAECICRVIAKTREVRVDRHGSWQGGEPGTVHTLLEERPDGILRNRLFRRRCRSLSRPDSSRAGESSQVRRVRNEHWKSCSAGKSGARIIGAFISAT